MQSDNKLALLVMAGEDKPFGFALFIMGQAFRINPALLHFESDTERTVPGYQTMRILNNGIRYKSSGRMLGSIVMSRVCSCRHLKMNIDILIFQAFQSSLNLGGMDRLHHLGFSFNHKMNNELRRLYSKFIGIARIRLLFRYLFLIQVKIADWIGCGAFEFITASAAVEVVQLRIIGDAVQPDPVFTREMNARA